MTPKASMPEGGHGGGLGGGDDQRDGGENATHDGILCGRANEGAHTRPMPMNSLRAASLMARRPCVIRAVSSTAISPSCQSISVVNRSARSHSASTSAGDASVASLS
jgi:hypothetical protein